MTYAFVQDVPANAEMYAEIEARIRASIPSDPPAGMLTHVVIEQEVGLRYVDVWASFEDWERFRVEHVEPCVSEVLQEYGLPHDHDQVSVTEVTVLSTWLGEPVRA
jgi:hypothetical protein